MDSAKAHNEAMEVVRLLRGATVVIHYFADMGPHAGKYRVQIDDLYLTEDEIEALNDVLSP